MNAPSKKFEAVDANHIRAPFFRLRSHIIDEFAIIERAVVGYLEQKGQKEANLNHPLGHKIKLAKAIPASAKLSKSAKQKADVQLDEIANYLPVRADVVHSKMTISVTLEGEIVALFVNAKGAHSDYPEGRIFDEHKLCKLLTTLRALNKQLLSALNPASSPPQPTRGAAAGP